MFVQERTNRRTRPRPRPRLVKRLVELHGGNVEAQSAGVGHGSTFVVRLPLPAPETFARSGSRRARGGRDDQARAAQDRARRGQRRRAEIRCTSCSRTLGHHTATAADGKDGAELILATEPDVAFVDIGLPDMDGYEVAARVR